MFNPFNHNLYCLIDDLFVAGVALKLGDKVPQYAHIMHVTSHYNCGVIGTLGEKQALGEHALEYEGTKFDAKAKYLLYPGKFPAPYQVAEYEGQFRLSDFEGLTKKEIKAEALHFGIKIEVKQNVKVPDMLAFVESEAKRLNLIPE